MGLGKLQRAGCQCAVALVLIAAVCCVTAEQAVQAEAQVARVQKVFLTQQVSSHHRSLKAGKLFECKKKKKVAGVPDLPSTLHDQFMTGTPAAIKKKCQKVCTGVRRSDCGGFLTSPDRKCYILPKTAAFTTVTDNNVNFLCIPKHPFPPVPAKKAKSPPPSKATSPPPPKSSPPPPLKSPPPPLAKPSPPPPASEYVCKPGSQPDYAYDDVVSYLYDSFSSGQNADARCLDGCKTVYKNLCVGYALQNWQDGQVRCFVFNFAIPTKAATNGFITTCQKKEFNCQNVRPNLSDDDVVSYLYDAFSDGTNANARCAAGCKLVYGDNCVQYALQNSQMGQVRCYVFNTVVATAPLSSGFTSTCKRNI